MEWPTRSLTICSMVGDWLRDVFHALTDHIRNPGHSDRFRR